MSSWYVATDRGGVEGDRHWAPPAGTTGASARSVSAAAGGSREAEVFDADALLDRLDERVFLAEAEGASEPVRGHPGTRRVGDARLVSETSWDAERAAGFALDCLEHAFADERDLELPRNRTLGAVLDEARAALADAGSPERGAFSALGRLARLRQLRRTKERLGTTAFGLAKQDEREDLDLLDDPAWATLAALGEGVLAALEALRTALAPRFASASEERGERSERDAPPPGVVDVETPWGALRLGGRRLADHVPAAQCAREAAERARQAVASRDGETAATAERAWQVARLEAVLLGG